ncbi:MAG: cytochrome c peroxidase [Pseudohongiellaceae bacterium]|jgi:cytochrome c peroxidase
MSPRSIFLSLATAALLSACALFSTTVTMAELEADNPVRPLPTDLVGHDIAVSDLPGAPDPEKARLGRWLYYDTRMSADNTVGCFTCHLPEFGFSEPTPVSTGIDGQMGGRKAPSFINSVFAFYPATFWDGRAASLEEQAIGPIANPIEMGNTHEVAVQSIAAVPQYAPFFAAAFGDAEVTLDRIAEAIADYERTRISHNSRYDQWRDGDDEEPGYVNPLTDEEILGSELFFGKALCATCHVGTSFTDSKFHNLGVGWDATSNSFADEGRSAINGVATDLGAFKTPGLRETTLHAPYMHDGSMATLREVMEHYNVGGIPNPTLSPKMKVLNLNDAEIDALVAFMYAIEGEGWQDTAPQHFPR